MKAKVTTVYSLFALTVLHVCFALNGISQCTTPPSNLSSTALSPTSAQVSFTGGSGTTWEIQYGPIGFTLGTGTTQNTSSTTTTINSLASNLIYDFYVRGNCGSGNFSSWAGPMNMTAQTVACDNFNAYNTGAPASQSTLILNWGTTNGGLAAISTEQSSSSPKSLKVSAPSAGTFTDVVAKFPQPYTSGIHNLSFDLYVASGHGGYYNILHNYVDGVSNTDWAVEIDFDSSGNASPDFAPAFNYNVGTWNTLEHIIDLDNDTAFIIVNGNFTNTGWVFSVDNGAYAYQFNAVDFYVELDASGVAHGQPSGHMGLEYFDNLCVTDAPINDVGVSALLLPSGSICGDSSYMIPVVVKNFAYNNVSNFDIDLNVTGGITASLTYTYTGTLKPGKSDTILMGPINTISGATVTITAETDFANETNASNDATTVTNVVFLPGVTVEFGPGDTSFCNNQTFNMVLNAQNANATYLWNDASTAASKTVTAAGTYAVTVTHTNGCTATDQIIVTQKTAPTVDLGEDLSECENKPVSFFLNAGNAGLNILWNTGATTQFILANQFGTYSVTVTANNGCTSTDQVEVIANPLPVIGFGEIIACVNDTVMLDAGSPGATYVWSVPNQFGQTYFVSNSGSYAVTVTDTNGCQNSDTAYVTLNPVPFVSLGDHKIWEGQTVTLDAGNPGMAYKWNTGAITQVITVTKGGIYYVTVTNSFGCEGIGIAKVTDITGVTNVSAHSVKLYPNPAEELVTLEANFHTAGKLSVDIHMANGQLVRTQHILVTRGPQQLTLDMSNLPAGVYLLNLNIDGQHIGQYNLSKL